MRLISIVLSLTALGFASGAIAQSPSIDRKIAQQQNAKGEYAEKAPYRPCPTVASINGRNVCLGCPGRCQWPPSFAKQANRSWSGDVRAVPATYQKSIDNHGVWRGRRWNWACDYHHR